MLKVLFIIKYCKGFTSLLAPLLSVLEFLYLEITIFRNLWLKVRWICIYKPSHKEKEQTKMWLGEEKYIKWVGNLEDYSMYFMWVNIFLTL